MKFQEFKKIILYIQKCLIELLFPSGKQCPVCHQEKSLRNGLGNNCFQKIALISKPICEKCGRPLRLDMVGKQICEQCETTRYYFDKSRSVAIYEGALREYLADLKYRYRPELGEAWGELLVEWYRFHQDFGKIDLIIPIPIHHQKKVIRGYNQAELLAKPLQRHLGIKQKSDIINRHVFTENQNALHKEARFKNVSNAFKVDNANEVSNSSILLIDDIFTTGATVSEAARILLRAGALRVNVLTLAAGVIESQWLEKEKKDGHQEL